MMLINKDHINELKKLYNDIDNCISDLVVARGRRDDNGIAAAHWQMETLMVNTQQTISYIIENLEVKEVDLEKEKDDYWNKLCDSEFGELLERDAKWFDDIARHFFELGIKAMKGE